MNKKILSIALIALFLGVAAFGAVKIVSAQQATDTPQATEKLYSNRFSHAPSQMPATVPAVKVLAMRIAP